MLMLALGNQCRSPSVVIDLTPHSSLTSYKARASPINPTAPTIPAAIALVGAAPAEIDVEGALLVEALAVAALVVPVAEPVPLDVTMVLLLKPVAVALAVAATSVAVAAAAGRVVRPAATSRERI
jgi:hypothetical protein